MRSPTSRVGYIEAEGMDLGSAKDDRKRMLTLRAVKTAFASSEQQFNNFESQLLLSTLFLINTEPPLSSPSLHRVPPLSTSLTCGNDIDPFWTTEEAFIGEIPIIPTDEAPKTPAEDFNNEIRTRGRELELEISSPARDVYIEEGEFRDKELGFERRNSEA